MNKQAKQYLKDNPEASPINDELQDLGKKIKSSLSCKLYYGLPCSSDRYELLQDMKKYLNHYGFIVIQNPNN